MSSSPSRSHAGYYRFANPSSSSQPKTPIRFRPAPLDLSPSSPTPSYSSTMSTASKEELKAKLEPILFSAPSKGSWKRALGFAPKPAKEVKAVEKPLSEDEVIVVKEIWNEWMERF